VSDPLELQKGLENRLADVKMRRKGRPKRRGWLIQTENDTGKRISRGKRVDRGTGADAGATDNGGEEQ
jgi:hypothetical protein